MVSYHGYWNYQDIIQSYDLKDIRRFPEKEQYNKESVYGYLQTNPDFTIFTHILKTANLDKVCDNLPFDSTLFVCDDETLRRTFDDSFFMNLDRNSALALINFHILNKRIGKRTLLSKRGCLIKTKKNSQISIDIQDNKHIHINQQAFIVSDEIPRSNGLIYILDNLLIPDNFTF